MAMDPAQGLRSAAAGVFPGVASKLLSALAIGALALVAPSLTTGAPDAAGGGDAGRQPAALALPDPGGSAIEDFGPDLRIALALSAPVPWRAFLLDDPARLVMDFQTVDWDGADMAATVASDRVDVVTTGPLRDGWSRMVVALSEPMEIETAGLAQMGASGAVAKLSLAPVDAARFATLVGPPATGAAPPTAMPADAGAPPRPAAEGAARPLSVMLDPGHGGLEPGGSAGGLREAALMLDVARELAEVLRAAGMEVTLTRDGDAFVPMAARAAAARAAGADVFLSLHADAAEGAQGPAIYGLPGTLIPAEAREAARTPGLGFAGVAGAAQASVLQAAESDGPASALARSLDRADLMAGADSARAASAPPSPGERDATARRTAALAEALRTGIAARTGQTPSLGTAAFAMLPATVPALLVELGSVASPVDRQHLRSAAWRGAVAGAVRDALARWAPAP